MHVNINIYIYISELNNILLKVNILNYNKELI